MNTDRQAAVVQRVSALLVVVLIGVLAWGIASWNPIWQQSSYYRWLASSGTQGSVTVTELGLARRDGAAAQVWVQPEGAADCGDRVFIDLSRTSERVTHVGQSFQAVYSCASDSPLANGPDGVAISSLDHNFLPDYALGLGAPLLVFVVVGSVLVVLRRSVRTSVAQAPAE